MRHTTHQKTTVALTSTLAQIRSIDVATHSVLSLVIVNTGANPVTAFALEGKVTRYEQAGTTTEGLPDEYVTLKNSSFSTADFNVVASTGELTNLAAGASVMVHLNVALLDHIHLKAASTLGTTLSIHAVGSQGPEQ
jgi:hypothetical protein